MRIFFKAILRNDNGIVKGISINTNDEKECHVESNSRGKELLNYIHENVSIEGKIRERLDGSLHISVRNYETIEDYHENKEAVK
ncbi:MAG: hypothetical protein PVF14_20830 [Desulfobacterales bacterium]|jgi:hypothetical protein